jgi:hypothetical protein
MAKPKRDKATPPESPDKVPTPVVDPTEEEAPTERMPVLGVTEGKAATEALLTLEQLDPLKSDFVRIDGVAYDLANRDAWGLAERLRVKRLMEHVAKLEQLQAPNAVEEADYFARMRELVQVALPTLPDDVLGKLQLGYLLDIWNAFLASRLRGGRASALMMLMRGGLGF